MGTKRRNRAGPHYADNSPAALAHNAKYQCRLARAAARKTGMPWLYDLSCGESREADTIGRNLVALGEREMWKVEAERARLREGKMPQVCTSFGINIERESRMTEGEKRVERIMVAAIRSGSRVAVELARAGRYDKAVLAIAVKLTG